MTRPFATADGRSKAAEYSAPADHRLSHKGKGEQFAKESGKGIGRHPSRVGAAVPESLDLAHRNGDKRLVCTAATYRFLLEAPPLVR